MTERPSPEQVGPPRDRFINTAWHARELAALFRPAWHLVAHASEIAEPGAYITFSLGEEEIIVLRAQDGVVRAFHNVCRHRGHRLCTANQGRLRRNIVCPYHGWSYSATDGSCVTAVRMHEGFDRSQWSLLPAWAEECEGLVFASLAETKPASIADRMGELGFGGYDMGRMTLAARKSYEVNANWKIVVENNLECYHCALNHPTLCTTVDPWDTGWEAGATGGTEDDVYSLSVGEQSWTSHGEQVCAVPAPRLDDSPFQDYQIWFQPGNVLLLTRDYGWAFTLKPLAPGRTLKTDYYFVHQDAQVGVDYELDKLTGFFTVTMAEDKALCEEVQRGVSMPRYTPGPLNRIHQSGQLDFYEWYERRLATFEFDPASREQPRAEAS